MNNNFEYDEDYVPNHNKHTMGILMGLFLGLIGLIIGVCIFPEGTTERSTFVGGWTMGFLIDCVIGLLAFIVYFVYFGKLMDTLI